MPFTFQPIGFIESPYRESSEIPKGLGVKHEAEGVLNVLPEFETGLADIDRQSAIGCPVPRRVCDAIAAPAQPHRADRGAAAQPGP